MSRKGWAVTNHQSGYLVEKVQETERVGFDYLMLWLDGANLEADWAQWRTAAFQVALPVVPGAHCHTEEDVRALLAVASRWDAPGVGVNIEDEAQTVLPPAKVAQLTAGWTRSLAVIVDWRGYLDPDGTYKGPDWTPVADRAVGVIEAFTNDGQQRDVNECLERLRVQGFRVRVPMPRTTGPRNVTLPAGGRCGWTLDNVAVSDIAGWAA